MKSRHKFLATLIILTAALTTTGSAADPHSKLKVKRPPPLPPGLEWADTNHDGKLSDAEFKRAAQILNARIQKVKNKGVHTAKK